MFHPPGENAVETKMCLSSGHEFVVTDRDQEVLDQLSPVFGDTKCALPFPSLSPKERERRRLAWRNELGFHRRKCDLTGASIVSLYSPDKPYKVYSQKAFWGDDWSPFDSGKDFVFDRPFFDQFDALLHEVPIVGSVVLDSENSEYNNYIGGCKDVYMSVRIGDCRDVYYSYLMLKSDMCFDCSFLSECNNCLGCIDCEKCYETFYSRNCKNCQNVWYSKDCTGCSDCFLCVGIHNQQYCIQNKKHTPEEYAAKKEQLMKGNPGATLDAMIASIPQREHDNLNSTNVVGNHVKNCEDLFWAFDSMNLKYGKYLIGGESGEHQYDTDFGHHGSYTYETISTYFANNALFSYGAYNSSSVLYSFQVNGSQNVFGCANLKKGNNCAFNKAYSKQEYDQLCTKIVDHMRSTGEWGEFFPYELSPFGYNETVAQEVHPVQKDETSKYGCKWFDEPSNEYTGSPYAPRQISDYDENVVGSEVAQANIEACLAGVFVCEQSKKPFRLSKKELAFYIQHSISLPTLCPEERRRHRVTMRNPYCLWERSCDKCEKQMYTSFSPERKERIFCEECYRKEIY